MLGSRQYRKSIEELGQEKFTTQTNSRLAPHLLEVCSLLALALMRLRNRAADDNGRIGHDIGDPGDILLPITGRQSVYATPTAGDAK
jgi:hypothetical protein